MLCWTVWMLFGTEDKSLRTRKSQGQNALGFLLPCRIQHIFDEDPVAFGGFVDKNVGNGADDLAVLNNRVAAHG